jgi:outer membrane lipoprotein SlyB
MNAAKSAFVAALTCSTLLLGACAGAPYGDFGPAAQQPVRVEYGTVEAIEMYRAEQPSTPINLGTVLGGVAGGIIGHQIGGGRGNTAATIAGALGGAYAGNQIERSQEQDRYRVIVRLDSGATLAVPEVGQGELRVGDRVRVINNRVYRA